MKSIIIEHSFFFSHSDLTGYAHLFEVLEDHLNKNETFIYDDEFIYNFSIN
jgi:hypothetical protein